jgi:RNA polymerase sigma-70 factor, ECF subfamily
LNEQRCHCVDSGVVVVQNEATVDETDRLDIAAARTGDEAAFARLVGRHQPAVARLLWRFAREPAQLDELVQDVFVEAYYGLDGYRGDAPLAHWLARIATRAGYRFWKKRSRQGAASLDGLDPPAPAADGLAEDADPAASGAMVHALLSRLAPAERLVLTLMYFDGCTTTEIAARMGWNRAMVKMRAYRARRRLRQIAEHEHLLERLGWMS